MPGGKKKSFFESATPFDYDGDGDRDVHDYISYSVDFQRRQEENTDDDWADDEDEDMDEDDWADDEDEDIDEDDWADDVIPKAPSLEDYLTLDDDEDDIDDGTIPKAPSLDDYLTSDINDGDEESAENCITISFSLEPYEPSEEDKKSERLKKELEVAVGLQYRKKDAELTLHKYTYSEIHQRLGDQKEVERCRFILESDSVAARYLAVGGDFLYAQAVKEHFDVPFEIPEEKDEYKTSFSELLEDLALVDDDLTMRVYHWCLNTFAPYLEYAKSACRLDSSMYPLLYDDEEFERKFVLYMATHEGFLEILYSEPMGHPVYVAEHIVTAIKNDLSETAVKIMKTALNNSHFDIHDIMNTIDKCIRLCSDWGKEAKLESMETFQEQIFPLIFAETDIRIKRKIPQWEKAMDEYIAELEMTSSKYAYTRKNAWREKYRSNEYGIDPIFYDSEEDILAAIKDAKYGWRKHCHTNRFGIAPDDFETEWDFELAIIKAGAAELAEKQRQEKLKPPDISCYRFCRISLNFPNSPFYYYLFGELNLQIGDRVIVPFGKDNTETEGVVVSLGECFGFVFPFDVKNFKTVIRKIGKIDNLH